MSGHPTSTPGAKAEKHQATAWLTSPPLQPFDPTLCCTGLLLVLTALVDVRMFRLLVVGRLSLMRGWEESGCRHVTASWHDPCIGRHTLKDLGHFELRHLAVGMQHAGSAAGWLVIAAAIPALDLVLADAKQVEEE